MADETERRIEVLAKVWLAWFLVYMVPERVRHGWFRQKEGRVKQARERAGELVKLAEE